jgi:hypothetical protein
MRDEMSHAEAVCGCASGGRVAGGDAGEGGRGTKITHNQEIISQRVAHTHAPAWHHCLRILSYGYFPQKKKKNPKLNKFTF